MVDAENRVVVTGLGAVTCFGVGVGNFWRALREQSSGQKPITSFDATNFGSDFGAEIPWDRLAAEDDSFVQVSPSSRATIATSVAAREAFLDSGLTDIPSEVTGCVIGSLSAHVQVNERCLREWTDIRVINPSVPEDMQAFQLGYQLEYLVSTFGLAGPASLVSAACASSTDAIGYALDLIRGGEADIMLTGGVDLLSESTQAGFNSLFSITTDVARPFDSKRSGFFLGDGAGMLVLERADRAEQRGARIYAEVLGYGSSNAAFHLTATSDDGQGEALAIKRCLNESGLLPCEVDYINAHGTATLRNDASEIKAIHVVFGDHAKRVAVSSIKPNIGHCLGAAGALEAIATIKCLEQGLIPPTLHSRGDLDSEMQIVAGQTCARPLKCAISQSFGFGGVCAAVAFRAV